MTDNSTDVQELIQRLGEGDQNALAELFARYREQMRRMVKLRLDRRLQGRVDPSDVLQEAYLDVATRAARMPSTQACPSCCGCASWWDKGCW